MDMKYKNRVVNDRLDAAAAGIQENEGKMSEYYKIEDEELAEANPYYKIHRDNIMLAIIRNAVSQHRPQERIKLLKEIIEYCKKLSLLAAAAGQEE